MRKRKAGRMESENIKRCAKCGAYFNKNKWIETDLCPECFKKDNELFDKVRDYLNENPDSTGLQICEALDIPEKQIRKWLKEERLILKDPGKGFLVCERCGNPIKTGRFCDECKGKLTKDLGAIYAKKEPERKESEKTVAKMRFFQG
jgi:flagellar operon protein (TIGR03826 family)